MLNIDNISVRRAKTPALQDISLTIGPGRTLAVVGESGAGKSTLIASILGMLKPWRGSVTWSGAPVKTCRPALVMQEPRAAFNPVLPLKRSVMEPLRASKTNLHQQRLERLCAGLELTLDILDRKPTEISIGQAQRAGILRALIAAPPLILFDEPLSALDAVTQKHTARLIADLQAEEGFAALIVTHDLGYACAFSQEMAVLKSGRIVEISAPEAFISAPKTEYGQKLRDAAFSLGALEQAA